MTQSILDKEKVLMGTLLQCNNVIYSLAQDSSKNNITKGKHTKLFENCDLYRLAFMNMTTISTGIELKSLNESINDFITENNAVEVSKFGNYYAYFKKVMNFLNGYDQNILKSLNESIKSLDELTPKRTGQEQKLGGGKIMNFTKNTGVVTPTDYAANITPVSDISAFKNELKKYISELEHINDVSVYDNMVIRMKILTGKPLFVYGMNITRSVDFVLYVSKNFHVSNTNLLAIYFNKNNRTLVFVYDKNFVLQYGIANDEFEKITIPIQYNKDTFEKAVKEYLTYNMLALYQNIDAMTFSDNLYFDNRRNESHVYNANIKNQIHKI